MSQNKKWVFIVIQEHLHKKPKEDLFIDDEESDSDSDSEESDCDDRGHETIQSQPLPKAGHRCKLEIKAWSVSKNELKDLPTNLIHPDIHDELYNQPQGKFVNMQILGNDNEYMLQTLQKHVHLIRNNDNKLRSLEYKLYNLKTGKVLFTISNMWC